MNPEIYDRLIRWYRKGHRDLPWRLDQDPYHVWISEIMLQQTRVEAVKGYYLRFLEALPTVQDLAVVEEETLLKLWEGLGYYNRARNLKKAAIEIALHGFPSTYQSLQALPGIGAYTAGAIASICFNEPVPAIDGNVFRVMMRVLDSEQNISKKETKENLFMVLQKGLKEDPGTFNQALMELGATICVPNGEPNCKECPLSQLCLAKKNHTILNRPIKDLKKERKIEERTILLLVNYDRIAIEKRPARGLLAGLYQFPTLLGNKKLEEVKKNLKEQGIDALQLKECGSSKHIFTHLEWHMQGYYVTVTEESLDYQWVSYSELKKTYALPSAFRYYLNVLEEEMKKKTYPDTK